ncbi:DNA mismatch repair protein MutS [Anaeropeptidivorans aminofermentans]|jgi:DNA mismatch repair protein MutS|uniref:DNA mismatch repair protein MutS n=1 Tax=Anaeropeptidivorans aminofermentans TaxID=2934315 RepID=UPI002023E240|nr:DNA mismatch repair protein MutS [Anaeropeptidivorans aminofermentans]
MENYTPMMKQYFEIKQKYSDCILFYRLGDFYEMFFDDAITASRELDITLTGRDCGMEERAPMCGVPFHSAEGYIAKLIEKGYKVAICEQIGDPKLSKTIVKREVIRIVTPGTLINNNFLDDDKNNYIMCIYEEKRGYGIAYADVSTGDFLTTSFNASEERKVIDEIAKLNPAEIIIGEGFSQKSVVESIFSSKVYIYNPWAFEYANALKKLCAHFDILNLNCFGIEDDELSVCACGALMEYLHQTQMNSLNHISTIKKYTLSQYMFLDISSRRNLELCETIRDKNKKGSLLWVLDKTVTSMGGRLMRKWIEEPLLNCEDINKRLNSVEEYKKDPMFREEIKELLNTIYDIERILGRIIYQAANARDLVSLKKSLEHLPSIKLMLMQLKSELNTELFNDLDCCEDIYKLISRSIVEEPPFSIREGGFIKLGFNETLDHYKEAKEKGGTWLKAYESEQRELTGIKNLKINFNKVFGYYIEITNSYKGLAPENYIRRQTLANAERYTTPELKKIEEDILKADDEITRIEYDIFVEIRNRISKETVRIQKSAEIIAKIDVLRSLGEIADLNKYVKPEVNTGGIIDIIDGRHPVVEKMTKNQFIPNDSYIDTEENRLSIITGPNMAGKSTFMRQTALIVLMAQIGSFVPAKSAVIGVVDRIFTRVGASDDLATGQSTFMVEMSEVANILNNATKNSLLILDEIGRGTSTFDGLSIAWAVLEYIADKNKIGAKTLFATHYHELTELEGKVSGVVNYRVTVEERGRDIFFLRKIERGGADRSYGIHVARIAGVPEKIIERANEIMLTLLQCDIIRKDSINEITENDVVYYRKKKPSSTNSSKKNIIIEELKNMDIDALTPREALMALYDIKSKVSEVNDEA